MKTATPHQIRAAASRNKIERIFKQLQGSTSRARSALFIDLVVDASRDLGLTPPPTHAGADPWCRARIASNIHGFRRGSAPNERNLDWWERILPYIEDGIADPKVVAQPQAEAPKTPLETITPSVPTMRLGDFINIVARAVEDDPLFGVTETVELGTKIFDEYIRFVA